MNNKHDRTLDTHLKRVAIVGCGNISGDIDDDVQKRHIYTHAKAISKIEQLSITACCDADGNRLKGFSEKWGIPARYQDLDKCCQRN
jgi:predicted dehydrogenase